MWNGVGPALVLTAADDLVQAVQGAGRPLSGRFRLGVIPTIAPFLLPRALPRIREKFPELKLYLREDLTPRLLTALKAGELDAALIALPYDMTGLEWVHSRMTNCWLLRLTLIRWLARPVSR